MASVHHKKYGRVLGFPSAVSVGGNIVTDASTTRRHARDYSPGQSKSSCCCETRQLAETVEPWARPADAALGHWRARSTDGPVGCCAWCSR